MAPGRDDGVQRIGPVAWLLVAAATVCSGCDAGDESRDAAMPAAPARRIVTLAPHLTELAFSAGAGDWLVGVVEHSDFPGEARDLPRIGDAFRIDFEQVSALRPDLILAWNGGNPQEVIDRLRDLGYRVESVEIRQLDDVATALVAIGRLAGSQAVARREARRFTEGLTALERRHAGVSELRAFFQISLRPLYTVNGAHPISQMLGLCGGRNVFADLGQLAPAVSREAVIARDPQVIIAGDPPGRLSLEEWRRWPGLTAVAADNLFQVPSDLVSRPSTRLLAGAEQLCGRLAIARERLARRGAAGHSARAR